MQEPTENTDHITLEVNAAQIAQDFKLSMQAARKVAYLIGELGLTLDDVKTMELSEIQMRHEAYLLEKSAIQDEINQLKKIEVGKEDPNKWRRLKEDLDIFEAQQERKKRQEEMAHVRETVPAKYANRAERRRILRENKRNSK